jgi:hypothetical protein
MMTRCLAVAIALLAAGCQHVCDASNCPDGCCGEDGLCWVDNTQDRCGLGGAACQACSFSALCTAGACIPKCNATNCTNGCCNEFGQCDQVTDISCGMAGSTCSVCGSAQHCDNAGRCSACGMYQARCTADADCCLGHPCQYDSLFGDNRCQ